MCVCMCACVHTHWNITLQNLTHVRCYSVHFSCFIRTGHCHLNQQWQRPSQMSPQVCWHGQPSLGLGVKVNQRTCTISCALSVNTSGYIHYHANSFHQVYICEKPVRQGSHAVSSLYVFNRSKHCYPNQYKCNLPPLAGTLTSVRRTIRRMSADRNIDQGRGGVGWGAGLCRQWSAM